MRNMTIKAVPLCVALGFAQGSVAEPIDGADGEQVGTASSQTPSAARAQQSRESARRRTMEEIVVTAQKREQPLQEVPISISVLGTDELDSYTGDGSRDVLRTVPGVTFTQALVGDATAVSIRGVVPSYGTSTVGYYLDGVPFGFVSNAIVPDTNVYDLARIEVLRGPQGTLYGASSLNGVVRVLTHDADLNAFQFKARTSGATTKGGGETYRVDSAINVPMIDGKLAARAAVSYADIGGWIDNLVTNDINGADNLDARLKVKAQPTEELSIGLSYWRSRHDVESQNLATSEDIYPGRLFPKGNVDFDAYGADIVYEFPGFTVSSTTSRIEYTNVGQLDWTAFEFLGLSDYLTNGFEAEVFSEELLVRSSNNSSWRWSLGAFYRDANDREFSSQPSLGTFIDRTSYSESYAVFGELTKLFLNGALELTGGIRYFDDSVENKDKLVADYNPEANFNKVSPRTVLTWHAREDTTLYASFSQGFRSGFNQNSLTLSLAPDFPSVKPDKLNNYEIGAKGSLWSKRLAYETAVYFVDWRDTQQNLAVYYNGGTFATPAGVNAESASGLGVDLTLILSPVDGLNLTGSFGFNDITMDSPVLSGGNVLYEKGDRLNYSSKYTAAGSASYTHPLGGSGLSATVSLSGSYTSGFPERTLNPGGTPTVFENDSFSSIQAALEVGDPGRWSLQLFADNLTDKRPSTQASAVFPWYSRSTRPRTIGLQFEFEY